jgi:hypothetical protein
MLLHNLVRIEWIGDTTTRTATVEGGNRQLNISMIQYCLSLEILSKTRPAGRVPNSGINTQKPQSDNKMAAQNRTSRAMTPERMASPLNRRQTTERQQGAGGFPLQNKHRCTILGGTGIAKGT